MDTMNINDKATFAAMVQLEGLEWALGSGVFDDYSYAGALREVYRFRSGEDCENPKPAAEDYCDPEPCGKCYECRSILHVIYGGGGIHRYMVRGNGEVLFSAHHATKWRDHDPVADAEKLGFTIS